MISTGPGAGSAGYNSILPNHRTSLILGVFRMKNKTLFVQLAAALSLLAAASPNAHAGQPAWTDVDLKLKDALWLDGDGKVSRKHQPADLLLHLAVRDGQWRHYAIGWAGDHRSQTGQPTLAEDQYNQMDHEAVVESQTDADGTILLDVAVQVNPDPWIPGGQGKYQIRLKREGRQFTGHFTGTFRGRDVKGEATAMQMPYPWPSVVDSVAPAKPGEHPRLLFRKSDLPALRAKMQTPQGQAILARLKQTLGGGESMPNHYQRARRAYGGESRNLPVGAYTLWHGMGFGFLYQLTGEQKYAELARQCVDKALAGQRDRDPRYSWVQPGGKLRAGSSYAAIAMAYDLCYDAWDPPYRRKIAKAIQDKVFLPGRPDLKTRALAEPVEVGLVFKTGGGQHAPWSNHYGAWNGGGGSAILAILGDEGTDDEITRRCHRIFLRRAKRALRVGYGHSAWFYEGHHGGRLSSNTGLITYLIHLRTSMGLDLVKNCPEAQWLVGKHLFEVYRQGNRLLCPEKGIYANGRFERGGMSTGGDFARGFGVAPDYQKPAIKWFFNHVVEPGKTKTYDAIRYPHHAVLAYLFWPTEPERNPAELVGKVLRDPKVGYYVFRSGWTGTDDDVLAAVYRGGATLRGMGLAEQFGTAGGSEKSFRQVGPNTCIIDYGRSVLVADMGGASGAALTFVKIDDMGPVQIQLRDPEKELTDQQKAFLKMLEEDRQAQRRRRRNETFTDPPATPAGRAALVQRRRNLDYHPCTIHTVTRGSAPEITMQGQGQDQTLTIGKLVISIRDGQVQVENRQ